MRAVMVVVLPEIPDDAEDGVLAAQMRAVAEALDIREMKGGRLIVTIRNCADAVLRAVDHPEW